MQSIMWGEPDGDGDERKAAVLNSSCAAEVLIPQLGQQQRYLLKYSGSRANAADVLLKYSRYYMYVVMKTTNSRY